MNFHFGKTIIGSEKTVIIAEAGVNHLGRMDYAEELIKTSARAGADIIKFQTYKANKLTTKNAPRFWNWEGEENQDGSQFDSYSKLDSFGKEQFKELIKLCDKYSIEFLSTPFDIESVDMLVEIGTKGFKIASCDINNYPLISHIASKKLPIFLSTGAATIDEIQKAVLCIESQGNFQICIMHCTLCYPTKAEDANLSAINHLSSVFEKYPIGLSDHSLGILIPSSSVLYGASVIEKHYTLDKTLPKSADHWLSVDENELKILIEQIRVLEKAKGSGIKNVLECEKLAHAYARRSIVAVVDIAEGAKITSEMIDMKRPGTGLSSEFIEQVIGKTAKKQICFDQLISLEDLE